jgi:hypothetical protein
MAAVVEWREDGGVARRVEREREGPRGRAEPAQETLDPGAEEVDPTVGEARGQEGHDLAVVRVRVAPRVLDRVVRQAPAVVEVAV